MTHVVVGHRSTNHLVDLFIAVLVVAVLVGGVVWLLNRPIHRQPCPQTRSISTCIPTHHP